MEDGKFYVKNNAQHTYCCPNLFLNYCTRKDLKFLIWNTEKKNVYVSQTLVIIEPHNNFRYYFVNLRIVNNNERTSIGLDMYL